MSNSDTAAFDLVLLGTIDPFELYRDALIKNQRLCRTAEKYIKTGGDIAVYYAENFIKESWPEFEKYFLTHSRKNMVSLSYMMVGMLYSNNVLKQEWPEFIRSLVHKEFLDYDKMKRSSHWPHL